MKQCVPAKNYPSSGRVYFSLLVAFPNLRLVWWLMAITTQSWGQCFQTVPTPATSATAVAGYEFQSSAVADFNADGKPDLVTVNQDANSVSVVLSNGFGGFATATSLSVGKQPYSVTTGDFNADGKTDIVTADYGDNTVSVLLNNGIGGFSAPTPFTVGDPPVSVISSDFNGDGKLDLATANQKDNTLSLLMGDGTGAFAKPIILPTGEDYNHTPKCIRAGDFNGDKKPDLVVLSDYYNSKISLLLNKGDGSFGTPTIFDALLFAHSVEVGDFNADGKLDLVTAGQGDGRITLLLNDGKGGFRTTQANDLDNSPYYVAVGDYNKDGQPDLAFNDNGSVAVLTGKGNGSFNPPVKFSVAAGSYVRAIVTGDFNADGKADLVVSTANQVSVLLNCTIPPIPLIPPTPTANPSQTATVGLPFSYTTSAFTSTQSPASLTYSASISPANGLSFDPDTRVISGTPISKGVSSVTVVATDSVGLSAATSFTITVSDPPILGVADPAASGVTVSPNPATDIIRITLTSAYSGWVVLALIDNRGQAIQTQGATKTTTLWQHSLVVQSLPPGVYYLRVQEGEQQTLRKVLKL